MRKVVDVFKNDNIAIVELKEKFITTLALVMPSHKKPSSVAKKFRSFIEECFEYDGSELK